MTQLELGRGAAAIVEMERLQTRATDALAPCLRANLLNNLAWARLRTGDAPDPSVRRDLEAALALHRTECRSAPPARRANVLVNLALDALLRRDVEGVRHWLSEVDHEVDTSSVGEAEPSPTRPEVSQWRAEIEARLALDEGRNVEALSLYEALAERADSAWLAELRWRALVGQGLALDAAGRAAEAVTRYARAETQLYDESLLIPVDRGRVQFLGDRETSARRLVDGLVRLGRTADAMAAARRARRRAMVSLRGADRVAQLPESRRRVWDQAFAGWQRARDALDAEIADDWERSADEIAALASARARQRAELRTALDGALAILVDPRARASADARLRSPSPAEVVITWFPGTEGWLGFAATTAGVEVHRWQAPPTDGEAWLAPFTHHLTENARLRLPLMGRSSCKS